MLYGYRQEFAAAEADLHEAAQLCAKLELDLSLGFVHQNLGWISGLRGDVPAALHYLDLAEQRLRAHGAPVGELLADRCQLLLSVRLLSEAMQAAEEAVLEFEQQRRKIGLPEARLLLAQAAILDGQAGRGLQEPAQRCASSATSGVPAGRRWPASPSAGAAGRRRGHGGGSSVGVQVTGAGR